MIKKPNNDIGCQKAKHLYFVNFFLVIYWPIFTNYLSFLLVKLAYTPVYCQGTFSASCARRVLSAPSPSALTWFGQWAMSRHGTWLTPNWSFKCHGMFLDVLSVGKPLSWEQRGQWEERPWKRVQPLVTATTVAHGWETNVCLASHRGLEFVSYDPTLAKVHPLPSGAPRYPFRFLQNCDVAWTLHASQCCSIPSL